MDCCCHLDLPIRNLDGLPGPEKVLKIDSNSGLFTLYSQDTFTCSCMWEPMGDQLLQYNLADMVSSFQETSQELVFPGEIT